MAEKWIINPAIDVTGPDSVRFVKPPPVLLISLGDGGAVQITEEMFWGALEGVADVFDRKEAFRRIIVILGGPDADPKPEIEDGDYHQYIWSNPDA